MTNPDELHALRAQIDLLTDQLGQLHHRLDQLDVSDDVATAEHVDPRIEPSAIQAAPSTTRRGWMKSAAAAAVGGTALALSGSEQAAAADTDSIKIGQTNNVGASRTSATQQANSRAEMSFLFRTESVFDGSTSSYPGALGGWTGSADRPTGVYGYSEANVDGAAGVVGRAIFASGVGVAAENESLGGTALVADAPTNGGTGVRTQGSYTGVDASGDQFAVIARSNGGTGVSAVGEQIGVVASGRESSLLLASTNTVAPLLRSAGGKRGSLTVHAEPLSSQPDLWFCAESGTPGIWRKLAGVDTAGAFHPIEPVRGYDSRAPEPNQGGMTGATNRVVSVADGRDLDTGAITVSDAVPKGATAITYNLTITQTVGAGFLALAPGSASDFAAAAINWSNSGVTVGNAAVIKLNSSREIKVFCEGGSTHFVLDITGYYL